MYTYYNIKCILCISHGGEGLVDILINIDGCPQPPPPPQPHTGEIII